MTLPTLGTKDIMKSAWAFSILAAVLPGGVEASVLKHPGSGLALRQQTEMPEDMRYDYLYEDGVCQKYFSYTEDPPYGYVYAENDLLQTEVCANWCREVEGKPGGGVSTIFPYQAMASS